MASTARPALDLDALTDRLGRPRRGIGARIHALLGRTGSRGRRRHVDEKIAVLRRFAGRDDLPESAQAFFTEALARLTRLLEQLRRLEVDDDLVLGWLEPMVAGLEEDAARVRATTRLQQTMRGPLPTTVVEEELVRRVLARSPDDVAEIDRRRQAILDELAALLGDVGAELPSTGA